MAKILVLEDDHVLAGLLQESLHGAGHTVQLHTHAADIVNAYATESADVIVADMIIMSNGRVSAEGGLSVSHKVKTIARKNGARVWVIAISGATANPGMRHILSTAQQLGADMVLEKPFAPDDLLNAIEQRP